MWKASKLKCDPARPEGAIMETIATMTAVTREAFYYAPALLSKDEGKWARKVLRVFPGSTRLPPMGQILLSACNLALVLSLCFYGHRVTNKRQYEMIAVRAGWVTLAQLPLVFLMSGKANIVCWLTGSSYERVNWIHRMAARVMLITATLHMGFFFRSWDRYDYIATKIGNDVHTRRGLGAFFTLLWLVLSSLAPIRGFRYEIFFIQHVISGIGFLVIVWMHIPKEAKMYLWFPVALWAFDRVVRTLYLVFNSFSVFHRKTQPGTSKSSAFACRALFHPLSDKATRITVQNPPFSWKPGQHAFVSCHSLVPFQSHPFTITSLPSDGYIEFVVRAQTGGTSRFHAHACDLLPPRTDQCQTVFIDGPYGQMRPLEQFDTVILIAGSTGASFTTPLLRELVRRKRDGEVIVTRRIRLVWVVKGRGQIQWFCKAIAEAMRITGQNSMSDAVLDIEASIFVTCDPELTMSSSSGPSSGVQSSRTDVSQDTSKTSANMSIDENKKPSPAAHVEEIGTTESVKLPPKKTKGCRPDGGCCCANVIDEDEIQEGDEPAQCCCCGDDNNSDEEEEIVQEKGTTPVVSSTEVPPTIQTSLGLSPTVNIVTGRPGIKPIINKELQRALGESAVVVCGPGGLVGSTRSAVVELCDERAVHKGTGAQGVCCFHKSKSSKVFQLINLLVGLFAH